jgi:hypothetical protein
MSSYQYIYNSQLDAFSLYHLTHEAKTRHSTIGPALPALGHATSGALGTAISKLVTYPLDLVVTRLQVQKQLQRGDERARYAGILDAIEKIYEREGGIAAFYSGVLHETAKGVADSFLFFLAYSYVRQSRLTANGGRKSLPALEEIGVGVVAGTFSKFWTTPMQNIVTRKQTVAMVRADATTIDAPSPSTREIAQGIYNEKGLQGFWSGYSASLILTLNPSITMLLHKMILRLLVPNTKRDDPGAKITFLVAAISKAMASTVTYPFSLAKTRAQVSAQKPTDTSGETSEVKGKGTTLGPKVARARQRTVFSTILRIAQTEGLWGLYQGLGAEVLKGFFSHGITMLMKERIHTVIINLYYMVLKALEKYPSPEQLATMASDEVKGVYAQSKEQVGGAYAKGVEVAGHAAERVREAVSEGSQQAQGVAETGKEQVSQAYGKASEATQATWSTGRENASAAIAKAGATAGSASSRVQEAVANGSRQGGEFVGRGKDAAEGAATRAKDAILDAEVRDIDGADGKGIKE